MMRWTLTAWTAASAPLEIPKPIWCGDNSCGMELRAWRQAHLEASLLIVHPTVIGRMRPLFFLRVVSEAPKKRGQIASGVLPSRTSVTNAVNTFRRSTPSSPAKGPARSFTCCGRRPSGPPIREKGDWFPNKSCIYGKW